MDVREVLIENIPSKVKLSEIVKIFPTFGKITTIRERSSTNNASLYNVIISYAYSSSALAAAKNTSRVIKDYPVKVVIYRERFKYSGYMNNTNSIFTNH